MIAGFTATRKGMRFPQMRFLIAFFQCRTVDEFHHGDCLGGDAEAHFLAHYNRVHKIIIHPPDNPIFRAFCNKLFPSEFTEVRPTFGYIIRNTHIVNEGRDLLIACPFESNEIIRSGTWTTVRYAKKISRPVLIVCPDGSSVPEIPEVQEHIKNMTYA